MLYTLGTKTIERGRGLCIQSKGAIENQDQLQEMKKLIKGPKELGKAEDEESWGELDMSEAEEDEKDEEMIESDNDDGKEEANKEKKKR